MRKSKKFAAVWMSAALVCSIGMAQAGTGTVVYATQETAAQEEKDQKDQKGLKEGLPIWLTLGENQDAPQYEAGAEGQSFVINVENRSDQEIKNIQVSVNGNSYWPFTATKLNYTGRIEKLLVAGDADGNDKSSVKFDGLTVLDNVDTANHPIQLDVYYEDAAGKGYKVSNVTLRVYTKAAQKEEPAPEPVPEPTPEPTPDAGTNGGGADFGGGGSISNGDVNGGGSTSASVPRVIVTGFNTEPAEVKAGSNFKLIIHLRNTSKQTAVKNLLFDLQAPTEGDASTSAPAFLPASGASSIYLDKIAKDGTQDIEIVLNAKSDLVQKPYSINIAMKYENGDAAQFDSAASVSIPVKQDARFEFSEFQLSSDTVEVGSEMNVMCSLYNLGKTKLYNVRVNFAGEGISAKEQFIGNVEPGATASIDSMLTGEKENTGDGAVKMKLSYEDEEGKVSTVEKDLTVLVTAPVVQEMDMADPAMMEPEKKFPVLWAVGGGAAIVAVIAGVIVFKKRKKRKLEMDEEEMADELDRLTEDE